MRDKIQELRKIVPIPMIEALQLLKSNDGDVEKCVYLFKAKCIREICKETGCDEQMANKYYEEEKFDLNRAVSCVNDALYDLNYKAIDGLTKEVIRDTLQWLGLVEAKDFGVSLDYNKFDEAMRSFQLIVSLNRVADVVQKAKEAKDIIFEGYTDEDSLDEFVRRHKRLDDNPAFIEANKMMSLSLTVIKDELLKHLRNL